MIYFYGIGWFLHRFDWGFRSRARREILGDGESIRRRRQRRPKRGKEKLKLGALVNLFITRLDLLSSPFFQFQLFNSFINSLTNVRCFFLSKLYSSRSPNIPFNRSSNYIYIFLTNFFFYKFHKNDDRGSRGSRRTRSSIFFLLFLFRTIFSTNRLQQILSDTDSNFKR